MRHSRDVKVDILQNRVCKVIEKHEAFFGSCETWVTTKVLRGAMTLHASYDSGGMSIINSLSKSWERQSDRL